MNGTAVNKNEEDIVKKVHQTFDSFQLLGCTDAFEVDILSCAIKARAEYKSAGMIPDDQLHYRRCCVFQNVMLPCVRKSIKTSCKSDEAKAMANNVLQKLNDGCSFWYRVCSLDISWELIVSVMANLFLLFVSLFLSRKIIYDKLNMLKNKLLKNSTKVEMDNDQAKEMMIADFVSAEIDDFEREQYQQEEQAFNSEMPFSSSNDCSDSSQPLSDSFDYSDGSSVDVIDVSNSSQNEQIDIQKAWEDDFDDDFYDGFYEGLAKDLDDVLDNGFNYGRINDSA